MWYRLCVGAAAAGGTKCRGVCSDQRGDVGIAPYATRRDVSFIIVGADAHVGPSVIGIVLQIPRLPAGKEVAKPWFRRAFGYFSRTGKVTRRRQTQPIQPPALFCAYRTSKPKNSPQIYLKSLFTLLH